MNQKYTLQSSLAIKRDVQKSQKALDFILGQIDVRKKEVVVLDSVLAEKRGLVGRFEEMILSIFQKENQKVAHLNSRKEALEDTIQKLETAKDLLNSQILLQKEQIAEPDSAAFVGSVIIKLSGTLDALLSKIEVSEAELKKLSKQREEFKKTNKKLEKDIVSQESVVAIETQKLEDIDKIRTTQLRELAKEKQSLTLMRVRERDSSAMNRRLTAEYKAAFDAAPKRKK